MSSLEDVNRDIEELFYENIKGLSVNEVGRIWNGSELVDIVYSDLYFYEVYWFKVVFEKIVISFVSILYEIVSIDYLRVCLFLV